MKLKGLRRTARHMVLAAVVVAGLMASASTEIEIVYGNRETGEFSLRLPVADRELALYSVVAKGRDSLSELSQWRNPHFVQTVPVGTTDLSVMIPPVGNDESYRFVLADPELATVTRVSCLIGGKDANGKFNSAFLTGLHPNWDWRYEIVFSVPEFGTGQGWLLCHRDSDMNRDSLLLLAVRGANGQANDKKLRFGHGSTADTATRGIISEGVVYQASINGRKCVYTNLTTGFEFEQVETASYVTDYGSYILCFGASVNGVIYNANDGCSFAQVYSFKAWDGSGELVADYRPIVKNSVAGYFDVVTRKFFKSGDGFDSDVFTPYVASTETLPADTLVEHLGEPVAVSSEDADVGEVLCVSESLPFSVNGLPTYGRYDVAEGSSITFELPRGEFLWTDAAEGSRYRVRAAGLRIDTYDAQTGAWVKGVPHYNLMSYTYTRKEEDDGARIVFLWDAEMLVDAPDGRRANCLRLVSVGKDANGKTAVGEGPFDTGVHPIPSTTRVLADVSFGTTDNAAQNAASPYGERRFFGIRDEGTHGSGNAAWQYNFQICRLLSIANKLRIDFCNYLDGGPVGGDLLVELEEGYRYQIDVNPALVQIYNGHVLEHEACLVGSVSRSSEPLIGTLHIFGQMRDAATSSPKLCVDYDNTRYYRYAIWQDGVTLTRDYVPCVDAANRPAFYDRVSGDYLYPIGDKAVYEAEFGTDYDIGSVRVTGETADGESATYIDPNGTMPGCYLLAVGESKTFKATSRKVFGLRVAGYRIDTWEDGKGWVKGKEQKGTSVTLQREESVRRLVWIWKDQRGLVIFLG